MKKLLAFIASSCLIAQASAGPVVTAVSGTVSQGSSLTVSGTGLPAKSRSKLLLWADGQGLNLAPSSTLSAATSFDGTQNVTVVTDSNKRWGNACFRSNWNYTNTQRAATFQAPALTLTYGSRYMVCYWEKSDINYLSNGGLSENWKFGVRVWNNINGVKYPDIIFGHLSISQTVSEIRVGDEFPTNSTYMGAAYGFPTTTWRRNLILVQMPSGLSAANGKWYIYRGNSLIASNTTQQMNDASDTGLPYQVFIQHVIANANVPSGQNWWTSDMALDDSWGRYEIGNASTYAASSHLELQPMTSATATNAILNLHLGTLSGSTWLYVCDNDNNCMTNGFSLTTVTNPAPTITSISPNHGSSLGSTTVTLTGTNLVATPAVKINGVDATGESFIDSSHITFVTPAGSASTTADVLLTNPDAQTATLTNGFSYDAAPAPTITSISPSSYYASGGVTVTVNGANFVATPTVKVGGTSATGVSFVNSSQITFTLPAGTANTDNDVVVTNPDAQNAILTNGFHYTANPPAKVFKWKKRGG